MAKEVSKTSRVGKRPVELPKGVEATVAAGSKVSVKGPKGSLSRAMPAKILVKKENEDRQKLYLELAAANRIEKKEVPKIAALFSAEWQRKCKVGWWIQGKKGKWEPKKPPKKKGRPAGGSK